MPGFLLRSNIAMNFLSLRSYTPTEEADDKQMNVKNM